MSRSRCGSNGSIWASCRAWCSTHNLVRAAPWPPFIWCAICSPSVENLVYEPPLSSGSDCISAAPSAYSAWSIQSMSHPYLPAVIELVRHAGSATLPFWRNDTLVTAKADASPVTAADLAAHHLLLAGLKALAPEIPVLSEEAADIPLSERSQWTRWWLGDPP